MYRKKVKGLALDSDRPLTESYEDQGPRRVRLNGGQGGFRRVPKQKKPARTLDDRLLALYRKAAG